MAPEDPKSNRLLAALPNADWQRWRLHLERVDLKLGQLLYEPSRPPVFAYFPTSAIVSLQYTMGSGASSEVAVVGNEGIVGTSLFLGGGATTSHASVLVAGQGFRIGAQTIRDEFDRSDSVRLVLLRYTQALITQIAQTAACNRHHTIDQQVCGWLLHSLDLLGDDLQCEVSESPGARDLFIAEAIAEMIQMQRDGVDLEAFGPLHWHFERIAEGQFNQSVFKLARRLGLAENTLSWRRRLELPTFVEVAYRLGLKPAALLSGTDEARPWESGVKKAYRTRHRMSKDQVRELGIGVAAAVRSQLQVPNRTIGVLDLAEQFAVTPRQLYAHGAESMKAVQEHNANARPLQRAERREQTALRAREVIRDLVAQRADLTGNAINCALGEAGVHWSFADARAAANDELDKLLRSVA